MYVLLCAPTVLDWFVAEANTYRKPSEVYDRRHAYAAVADPAGRLGEEWEVVVVCDRESIHGLAIVRRAGRVGEVESRFDLAAFRPFGSVVPLAEALTERTGLTVSIRLPPYLFGPLGDAATRRNHWFPETLQEYLDWANEHNAKVEIPDWINDQRDHTLLLGAVGGIPKEAFQGWIYQVGMKTYLDGLPRASSRSPQGADSREELSQAMIEDRLIERELRDFAGWEDGGCNGTYQTFIGGNRREEMRIYNVNREGAETLTGADLIYYNVHLRSIVLVQVKRLTDKGGFGKERGYRPKSDRNFDLERQRLRKIDADCQGMDDEARSPQDFRLYPHPSFFKFSDSRQPLLRKNLLSPVRGFILPLKHLDLQLDAGGLRGPKGGLVVVKSLVDRSLSPTMFIDLVKGAWVGSRRTGTDQLRRLIGDIAEDDRAMVIGVHDDPRQQTLF